MTQVEGVYTHLQGPLGRSSGLDSPIEIAHLVRRSGFPRSDPKLTDGNPPGSQNDFSLEGLAAVDSKTQKINLQGGNLTGYGRVPSFSTFLFKKISIYIFISSLYDEGDIIFRRN